MPTKAIISDEEEQLELINNCKVWNRRNPSYEIPLEDWADKLTKAKAEGYVSEKCSCGCVFLAFHHWTTCQDKECPFSDGVSLLERMVQDNET